VRVIPVPAWMLKLGTLCKNEEIQL